MPNPPSPVRIMIFVDFWNFTLNMEAHSQGFKIDWFKLPWVLSDATGVALKLNKGEYTYQTMFIAGSYDQTSQQDTNLFNWSQNTLVKVDGATVDFKPRQKSKKGPCCQGPAHHEIRDCPICRSSMIRTQEKGVDTQIAIEMVRCAWEDLYDVGVLVTEDKDFAPAVDYLAGKGLKFLHARFPNFGFELRKHCWGEIDIPSIRDQFKR